MTGSTAARLLVDAVSSRPISSALLLPLTSVHALGTRAPVQPFSRRRRRCPKTRPRRVAAVPRSRRVCTGRRRCRPGPRRRSRGGPVKYPERRSLSPLIRETALPRRRRQDTSSLDRHLSTNDCRALDRPSADESSAWISGDLGVLDIPYFHWPFVTKSKTTGFQPMSRSHNRAQVVITRRFFLSGLPKLFGGWFPPPNYLVAKILTPSKEGTLCYTRVTWLFM